MSEETFAQISFEFFPPKNTEGNTELLKTAEQFARYTPDFYSVTFGAGGVDQSKTHDTVSVLQDGQPHPVVPHISCIGSTKDRIKALVNRYKEEGIQRLVVLRGDLPEGDSSPGELLYASDLVALIREETGNHFHISVAAYPEYHPESKNPGVDLQHFIQKTKQGADQAITQYFYNPDAYFFFVDSCRENGVDIPIVPGIMPITNYKQLARFSDRCLAEIPRWIREKLAYLDARGDRVGLKEFGEQVVTLLCETLLNNGAPGLHFYTLNRFEPTHHILQNLMFSAMRNEQPA